ncbi:MAG: Gfo/Idh/MocA family oxidoreductase, partial [Victivallales bacterium]|nr:Gfo/Idh/MocA family oxidoreductase [Victivallales bacterium]
MAEKKKIGVAVLGTGNRGRGVVSNLLKDSDNGVEILAAYDPDRAVMSETIGVWNHSEITKACGSVEEAINTPNVEWVMIFSPNVHHKEQILAAFKAGKHV